MLDNMSRREVPCAVIIPAHRASTFLAKALRSVAWQTVTPAEIVIVDDGGNGDITADIKQAGLGGNVVVHRTSGGTGPSAARNFGISRTNQTHVAFLDADDIWYPGKLEAQWPLLAADVALVGATFHYVTQGGRTLGDSDRGLSREEAEASLRRADLLPVPTSSFLVRREHLEEIGGFPGRFGSSEDLYVAARLMTIGGLAWPDNGPHLAYLMHGDSHTVDDYRRQRLAAEAIRLEVRSDFREEVSVGSMAVSWRMERQMRAGAAYRNAAIALGERRWSAAVRLLLAALVTDPTGSARKLAWQVGRRTPAQAPPEVVRLLRS
jgi:glycosyltransferase involved in cell wall biosynthesis